jgi:hypothetical protein
VFSVRAVVRERPLLAICRGFDGAETRMRTLNPSGFSCSPVSGSPLSDE